MGLLQSKLPFLGLLILLFLPSGKLVVSKIAPGLFSSQTIPGFNQEPINLDNIIYTSEDDPYGYAALLNALYQNELSWHFQAPENVTTFSRIPATGTHKSLTRFFSENGASLNWVSREVFLEKYTDNSNPVNCTVFSSSHFVAINEPSYHFILVLEAGSRYIYIFDPLIGRVIYPCEYFFSAWVEGVAIGDGW